MQSVAGGTGAPGRGCDWHVESTGSPVSLVVRYRPIVTFLFVCLVSSLLLSLPVAIQLDLHSLPPTHTLLTYSLSPSLSPCFPFSSAPRLRPSACLCGGAH